MLNIRTQIPGHPMSVGCLPKRARGALLTIFVAALPIMSPAQAPFSGSYPLLDEDVIRYQSTPPNDPVARLQRRLDQGEAKLSFGEPQGYLLSVLRQLNVPLSSQALV